MAYYNLFKAFCGKVRYVLTVEWYNFFWNLFRKKHIVIPHIASIEETINKIVADRCSVSRFGDGEVLLTLPDKRIGFQRGSYLLSEKLIKVFRSNEDNHIVCLSDSFRNLQRFNRRTRRFWACHFYLYDKLWANNIDPNKQYYNTFFSRLYIDFKDKSQCQKWFNDVKKIWDNRDVSFIEGEKSRLGVGNDLFDNAKSIKRILGPVSDAFDRYDDLISLACKFGSKDTLFLIALGPTATCLAYDLYKLGFQAIDIGHIDIEYEWWRMGARRKVKINHKYVNEAVGGNMVNDDGDFNTIYTSQIVADIRDLPYVKKRKIVYCTPELYLPGGIERAVTIKSNYFADKLGYEIYVILTDGWGKKPFYHISNRVQLITLNLDFEELWDKIFYKKVFLYFKKQRLYKIALRKTLLIISPDITISCMRREINFVSAIPDGSKKIAELHINRRNLRRFDASPYDKEESFLLAHLLPKFWSWNLEQKLSLLSRFITLSNEDAMNWSNLHNLVVIPDPIEGMPQHTCDSTKKRVIAIGRYVPQKGFDSLLKIWKKVEERFPDWELDVYGPGERSFFIAIAKNLGIVHCKLHEAISAEEVGLQLDNSSIHVLPSRYEGFGMVIVEAMSHGLPCVSFSCPSGPSDIITDGSDGFLIEPGDYEQFIEKLTFLMVNVQERKRMGSQARKTAEKYTIDKIALTWVKLFDEILSDNENNTIK